MYVRYQTKDTHARIDCDRIAYHQDGRVMVLSCHGPQQTLRGMGAVLTSDAKVRLEHYDEDDCSDDVTREGGARRRPIAAPSNPKTTAPSEWSVRL